MAAEAGEQAPELLELDEADRQVGRQIKKLRVERGLSLKELSAKTGLSVGFLSQMERGLSSPSVKALATMGLALNVNVAQFFTQDDQNAEPDGSPVLRSRSRPQLRLWRAGITKELLAPQDPNGRGLAIFEVAIEPGRTTGETPYTHDGEEAGVVVEGTLELHVGTEKYTLAIGDGFRFASTTPHRFANPTRDRARIIWVNFREGAV